MSMIKLTPHKITNKLLEIVTKKHIQKKFNKYNICMIKLHNRSSQAVIVTREKYFKKILNL